MRNTIINETTDAGDVHLDHELRGRAGRGGPFSKARAGRDRRAERRRVLGQKNAFFA